MDVYLISQGGVEAHSAGELSELLDKPDALIWVDIPLCIGQDTEVLSEVFGFHDIAVRDCVQRNHVSKIHVYDDHVFTVLHAPEVGTGGHVHYVELDQFLGRNYLVTVHGPLNPAVNPEVAFVDTQAVLKRLRSGHLHPRSPFELSSAIIGSLTRREIELIAGLAKESGRLEQRVMRAEVTDDPEQFLEELFKVWYELLAIRTIAVHSTATYDRMAKLVRSLPEAEKPLVADIADRFEQVSSMADGQREFLHGVIEFFQTRISTHMTLAAEELAAVSVQQNDDMRKITAWVAIVAVPTAVGAAGVEQLADVDRDLLREFQVDTARGRRGGVALTADTAPTARLAPLVPPLLRPRGMDAGRPRRRDRPPKAPQAAPEAAVGRRAQAGDLGAPYHPGVAGPGRSPCQDGDRGVRLTVCRGRTPRSRIANGGDLT